uniref:Lipoprotein n=1 Tax=Glossina pallidipes TaxID=7398 RepID=A0A1A9ZT27_GLOPL
MEGIEFRELKCKRTVIISIAALLLGACKISEHFKISKNSHVSLLIALKKALFSSNSDVGIRPKKKKLSQR